jgi:hypothetical protein
MSAVFRGRGWSLLLTGTADTNRKLLISAGQGEVAWSLVTKANPAPWLDDARKAMERRPDAETTPATSRSLNPASRPGPTTADSRQPVAKPAQSLPSASTQAAVGPGNEISRKPPPASRSAAEPAITSGSTTPPANNIGTGPIPQIMAVPTAPVRPVAVVSQTTASSSRAPASSRPSTIDQPVATTVSRQETTTPLASSQPVSSLPATSTLPASVPPSPASGGAKETATREPTTKPVGNTAAVALTTPKAPEPQAPAKNQNQTIFNLPVFSLFGEPCGRRDGVPPAPLARPHVH